MSYDNYDVLGSDAYNNATDVSQPRQSRKYLNVVDYRKLTEDTKSFNNGEGITKFKFEPNGEYNFSFLPWNISDQHPKYKEFKSKGIPFDWKLNVFVHTVVTDTGSMKFICNNKTYGKPCPYCEERQRLFNDGGWEQNQNEIKKLNDSQRNMFLIYNHADGKVYVMDYSHYYFGEHLEKKLARANGTDRQIILADPRPNRWSLHFYIDPSKMKDSKGNPIIGASSDLEFLRREKAIDEDIVKNLPALEDYLVQYSYDDVTAIMDGTFFADGDDQEEGAYDYKNDPTNEVYHPPKEEPVKEEPVKEEPVSIGRQGPSTVVQPEMSEREKRRLERLQKQNAVQADPVCPVPGGVFGETTERFAECPDCPLYDACGEAFDSK